MDAMNRFRQHFDHDRHVFLPVVHATTFPQVMANAEKALQAGADGVFVITHVSHMDACDFSALLLDVTAALAYQDFWVGANFLMLPPCEVFQVCPPGVKGIWADCAGINSQHPVQMEAQRILNSRAVGRFDGLYFGGVEFKYQRSAGPDVVTIASIATKYVDVITTSGPGTGEAASAAKVRAMRRGAGGHPIALASGVTIDNVGDYLPYVDCFLVNTGISESWTELDQQKTTDLAQRIKEG
jgi:hypothetical protein